MHLLLLLLLLHKTTAATAAANRSTGAEVAFVTAGSGEPAVTVSLFTETGRTGLKKRETYTATTITRAAPTSTWFTWWYLCFMNAGRRHWP